MGTTKNEMKWITLNRPFEWEIATLTERQNKFQRPSRVCSLPMNSSDDERLNFIWVFERYHGTQNTKKPHRDRFGEIQKCNSFINKTAMVKNGVKDGGLDLTDRLELGFFERCFFDSELKYTNKIRINRNYRYCLFSVTKIWAMGPFKTFLKSYILYD